MRLVLAAVVAALVLVGCSDSPDEENDAPERSVEPVTFTSLGIDDWAAVAEVEFASAPPAPDGIDAAVWSDTVEALEQWGRAAAFEPQDFPEEFEALSDHVFANLPETARRDLSARIGERTAPHLGVATVFADAETIGDIRATSAWRASELDEGGLVHLLELQTRTAYEVTVDGVTFVVGVIRTQGLSLRPGVEEAPGTLTGWQEFGASDCVLALDDRIEPDVLSAVEREDLDQFAQIASGSTWAEPELGEDDVVDEDFLNRCRNEAT